MNSDKTQLEQACFTFEKQWAQFQQLQQKLQSTIAQALPEIKKTHSAWLLAQLQSHNHQLKAFYTQIKKMSH